MYRSLVNIVTNNYPQVLDSRKHNKFFYVCLRNNGLALHQAWLTASYGYEKSESRRAWLSRERVARPKLFPSVIAL